MFRWINRNLCCCISKRKNKKVSFNNNNNNDNDNDNNNNNDNANDNINAKNNIKYLENISYKDTTIFIPQIRFAKVVKVYDGDTITVAAKLPFDQSPIYRFSVRLRSIDSPEIKGQTKKECDLAIESRDALHNLIFGKVIELKHNGKEKYGRLLADLYYKDIHINKWMVDNGYAVSYYGGKKSNSF